jgi:hypothetical protein
MIIITHKKKKKKIFTTNALYLNENVRNEY